MLFEASLEFCVEVKLKNVITEGGSANSSALIQRRNRVAFVEIAKLLNSVYPLRFVPPKPKSDSLNASTVASDSIQRFLQGLREHCPIFVVGGVNEFDQLPALETWTTAFPIKKQAPIKIRRNDRESFSNLRASRLILPSTIPCQFYRVANERCISSTQISPSGMKLHLLGG